MMVRNEPVSTELAMSVGISVGQPKARYLPTKISRSLGRVRWIIKARRVDSWLCIPTIGPRIRIIRLGQGRVKFGRSCRIAADVGLTVSGSLEFSNDVFVGRWAQITCFDKITIGSDTRIAERVSIHDEDHVYEPIEEPGERNQSYKVSQIVIGQRVWIAANCVITSGASIGDDSVIAANSVVTGVIPPGVLAGGAPAKVIRKLVKNG